MSGLTQQPFCRELGGLEGGVEVSLSKYSWDMISGFQPTNVFHSKYVLDIAALPQYCYGRRYDSQASGCLFTPH